MASHEETKLPPQQPDDPVDDDGGDDDEDKAAAEPSSPDGTSTPPDAPPDSASGQIVLHYLTHETSLPRPSWDAQKRTGPPPPPEQPDLSKYRDPFAWPPARKRAIIWLSCAATCLTAFTAGAYAPGAEQMGAEFGVGRVACLAGITVFTSGFAVAPMVLAPFSELNGRRPVFVATGLLFVVGQMCCALARSFGGLLAARFFVGVGGSTFSTLVGGCVSDLYHKHDRNTPMALFAGAALFGTGLGPVCAGLVAQHGSWRWIFWMQLVVDGALMLAVVLFFAETRGSVLLSRKARALNQWYERLERLGYYNFDVPATASAGGGTWGRLEWWECEGTVSQRIRWKVKSDEERGSVGQMVGISLYRPFHLLLTEPVVFFFSLWVSFSWAILYLFFSAVSLVMSANHAFTVAQSGAVFAAISAAALASTALSIYQDDRAVRRAWGAAWPRPFRLDFACPEGRLYFSCLESLLMPAGMLLFGWTCAPSVHWIAPCLAVAVTTMGIFSIYLATFNYLADTYHRYASSALAAQSFSRNMLGGAAPLFTARLYSALGFGPASSLLAGCGLLLSLVPWVLALYGPRIRARSRFAREIVQLHQQGTGA